jgi:uncharacterized protein with gpF-like domain
VKPKAMMVWAMAKKLTAPGKKDVKVKAIRPNAGVEAAYRASMRKVVVAMANSYAYWLKAAFRRGDGPKATQALMDKLASTWSDNYAGMADKMADVFVAGSKKHTNMSMMAALKESGFTIEFKQTEAAKQAYAIVLAENVGLIRTIPSKYHADVSAQVWQSVKDGYDMEALTKGLSQAYGLSFKRAGLIARDQTSKAMATIEAANRADLGITQAIWVHSGGGKHPRPSHLKAGRDKTLFDVNNGLYLDGEWVLPGQAINCRCTSMSIIPGFEIE